MNDISDLIDRNRSGEAVGLPCFCTANEYVLRAVMQFSALHNVPAVIEATCNQVNQEGGYTGLGASDFANWIADLANEYGVPQDAIILGGDHLGPNPWRDTPADSAMKKAEVLVKDYAAAGYRKIHLDASMACGGEPTPSFELVAKRAARLCKIAEVHAPSPEKLIYIIGTEVPIPGGETDDMDELQVTTVNRYQETLDTHRYAFEQEGLLSVWPRIVSVVTQPGVDFSHTSIYPFKPVGAALLSAEIKNSPGMIFEAHSTDYQSNEALTELVKKHFFFLKVGPELTFRMREAVFALASIENQLLDQNQSQLVEVIDQAMDNDPSNWQSYYQGAPEIVQQLRHFSYSDRIRYYWNVATVESALKKLVKNLDAKELAETIISQHFPARGFGNLKAKPQQLILDHINLSVARYYKACGYC